MISDDLNEEDVEVEKMKMILTLRYSSNRIHYLIQRHFNLLLLALIYLSGGTTDIISAAAPANTEEMTTHPISSKNNNNMNNYPGFNKFPAGPFTSSSPNDNTNDLAGSQHAQYVTIWIKARNFLSICTRLEFSTNPFGIGSPPPSKFKSPNLHSLLD